MAAEKALKSVPAPEPTASVKEIIALANSLKLFEQVNASWRLVARNATAEDLLRPGFWSVVQAKIKAFDRIAVITGTHYFDLLCLYSEKACPVRMAILDKVEIPIVLEREHGRVPTGYFVDYDPAEQRYTARRESDNHPMGAPHSKYDDAYSELINHAIFRGAR